MFILIRNDGLFVSRAGSPSSYTDKLQHARQFASLRDAEAHACPGNERIVRLTDYLCHG